jgi:hypothetical protein
MKTDFNIGKRLQFFTKTYVYSLIIIAYKGFRKSLASSEKFPVHILSNSNIHKSYIFNSTFDII